MCWQQSAGHFHVRRVRYSRMIGSIPVCGADNPRAAATPLLYAAFCVLIKRCVCWIHNSKISEWSIKHSFIDVGVTCKRWILSLCLATLRWWQSWHSTSKWMGTNQPQRRLVQVFATIAMQLLKPLCNVIHSFWRDWQKTGVSVFEDVDVFSWCFAFWPRHLLCLSPSSVDFSLTKYNIR